MSFYQTSYWPGGACPGCNKPLQLYGSWHDPYELAKFVVVVLSFIAVLFCAFHQCFTFRKPRAGRAVYFGALISTLILFGLFILDTALTASSALVTYSYSVIFVFVDAFFYLSIILTLLALAHLARLDRASLVVIAGILTAFGVALVAIQIRLAVFNVNQAFIYDVDWQYRLTDNLTRIQNILDLVFIVLALIGTLYVGGMCFTRGLSTTAIVLATIGVLAFVAQLCMTLAADAILVRLYGDDYYYYGLTALSASYFDVSGTVEDALQALTLLMILLAGARIEPAVSQYQNGNVQSGYTGMSGGYQYGYAGKNGGYQSGYAGENGYHSGTIQP